ncbi:MAG: hypothetical protein AB8B64_20870 [Granulosicoccus sp.]
MKSTLPAQHLLRQYLLFAFTVTFLLTMFRAGLALWQFPLLEETNAFVALFVQGLRFDLALVGILCLVPIVVGSLLSMFDVTRTLARILISFFLFVSLLLILLLELITPWFVHTYALRPDATTLQNFASSQDAPLEVVLTVLKEQAIPAVVAVVLGILVLLAFWARLEMPRFLRYRLSVPGALATAVLGGVLCVFAIWSTPDLRKAALGPGDALISTDETVNDLAMNSTYKTLHSIALPYFNQ